MLFPAMENGVEIGQLLHPLVPSLVLPVYPEAQIVQTEALLPIVPVLAVLYPIPQAMHPDAGTSPSIEYVPRGHLVHTEESLPCVPELVVDLPVGQAEQPTAVAAEVELLYVPAGQA